MRLRKLVELGAMQMRNENATVEAKAAQVLANNRTSLITVRQKLATARQAQAAVGDELSPTYGTVCVWFAAPHFSRAPVDERNCLDELGGVDRVCKLRSTRC